MSLESKNVDVVSFFSNKGILTAEMAERAAAFVADYTADVSDIDMTAVVLLSEKTGEILAEFHARESSAFLDWCYLNGLILVSEIASFVNAVNKGRANGIAKRAVERKNLKEFSFMGMQYYANSAHNILNEVMYNSTEWKIVRLLSIENIDCDIATSKINQKGIAIEQIRERSRFLINGEYVVENYPVTRMIAADFLKCENSLIGISPTGRITIPRIQETFENLKGEKKRRTVAVEPTFSFMRISYTIVANNFFPLELGPMSVKFEPLAAETQQALLSSGNRDNFDEFQFIADSPEFSEQEKKISESLFLATEKNLADVIIESGNRVKLSTVLLREWFETFCAVANTRPHFGHFKNMVTNFRKHVRRVHGKMEPKDKIPTIGKPAEMGVGFNREILRAEFAEACRPRVKVPYCRFGSKWASTETIELNNGTELKGWIFQNGGDNGAPGFKTELMMVGGDGI